jgi:molybdate transport system substrate-binding protein
MADKVKSFRRSRGMLQCATPVAVVSESRQKALARDFIAYLSGAQGQAILARFGFAKP